MRKPYFVALETYIIQKRNLGEVELWLESEGLLRSMFGGLCYTRQVTNAVTLGAAAFLRSTFITWFQSPMMAQTLQKTF